MIDVFFPLFFYYADFIGRVKKDTKKNNCRLAPIFRKSFYLCGARMLKKLAEHPTSMAYNFSLHFFLISSFFSTFF